MALFGIGDLHLSLSSAKPMDVFEGWEDYSDRLLQNWKSRITNEDTVVIPGDLSWAMTLEQAYKDFSFINNLPGNKIILKGNHDYWWSTVKKIETWLNVNDFSSVSVLHNNSYMYGKIAITGTRGWNLERDNAESIKIYLREVGRLRLSLDDAVKKDPEEIIVFLHYPPIYSNYIQHEMIDLFSEYGIKKCFYGHVHGKSIDYSINKEVGGITYRLISADHLRFSPRYIL